MTLRRGKTLSIDMGTSVLRIVQHRRGLLVDEPNLLLRDFTTGDWAYAGQEAAQLIGRTPPNIRPVFPFRAGVIADFEATKAMLRRGLQQAVGRINVSRPSGLLTIAGTANSTERRALLDAATDSGLQKVYLLPAIYAAALGAGIAISKPRGAMIIHFGGGTCEVGLFSLGSLIEQVSLRVGGDDLDDSLLQRIRRESGVQLTLHDAQALKLGYLDLAPSTTIQPTKLKGLHVTRQQAAKATIKNDSLVRACEPVLDKLIDAAKRVIEASPPDLVGDVLEQGVMLSGGSAQLRGLPDYVSKRLKITCHVSAEPALCAVRGANLAETHLQDFIKLTNSTD